MVLLEDIWPYVAALLSLAASIVASVHIVLTKRDLKGAIGWIGVVWLAPYLGGILYYAFGINRIQRRATRLRPLPSHPRSPKKRAIEQVKASGSLPDLVATVTGLPLLPGNKIAPLQNGDEAFSAMIEAITQAKHSIALSTYIFDNDVEGQRFTQALSSAVRRGVEVRVLVDSVGSRYTFPRIISLLRHEGVPVAEFLHSFVPWRLSYLNLRNHRKIMVVDGRIGFTGGMNIRAGHVLSAATKDHIQDVHFRVHGPAVEHLMNVFADDWAFSTDEVLEGSAWFPVLKGDGQIVARGVASGPDEDYDKLKWVILAALAQAKQSVRIVTPYFLPDEVMVAAINLKALSGVDVDIIVPEQGNLRLVQWASRAQLGYLIVKGCRVWLTPEPFDHSKLFVIDDQWAFIGSANWDSRSLYLNFEFNMECYGKDLADRLSQIINDKIAVAKPLTLTDLKQRPFLIRVRDGIARLCAPYL